MWLKNFRNKKLQTFLVGMIILMCAMLISTSLSVFLSLNEPLDQLSEECDSAYSVVYPYQEENPTAVKELAERLEELPQIEKAVCLEEYYINEKLTSGAKEIVTFTKFMKYEDEVFGKVRLVDGDAKNFYQLEEKECLVPACVCVENDLNVGDEISMQLPGKKISYRIKGIYSDIYSTSNAFTNYILVKELPKEVFAENEIRIYTKENIKEEEILDHYEEKYGRELEGQLNTRMNAKESSLLAVKITGGILFAVGIVMLITCCLIINFILRSMMTADAKTIAIYKTIGYVDTTIRAFYLKFYLMVTTLGTAAGIILSKFFANMILNEMFANIGLQADVKVGKIGIGIYIVMLILILATVYLVTAKMKKMKPVYALTGMSPTNTKKQKKYKGHYSGSFSPMGIALRMVMRDKKGTLGILFVAIISVIGINFGLVSLDVALHLKENNDYWLGIDRSDIMITVSQGSTAEKIVDLLKDDHNIEQMIPCSIDGVLIVEREKNEKGGVVYPFVYQDYSKADVTIVEGRNPENGGEIALAGKISDKLNKEIGDYITLNFEQEKKIFLITGLYHTYYNMGESCRLTREAYEDTSFAYKNISVYLKDSGNLEEEVDRIEKKLKGCGKVEKRTEMLASIMEMIAQPQESAIPVITAMVLIIGGINIFCIILLKNQREIKMNSIYKSLGYTSGHLMTANLCFVGILAVICIVIAVPLLLWIYPHIMEGTLGAMFGLLEYKVNYNLVYVVLENIAVFIVFIMSTLLSSRGIRKIQIQDLVIE